MNTACRVPRDVDADILCERISRVCREIGVAVSEIEGHVVASTAQNRDDAFQIQNLQKIDLVLQSIEEIALFVGRCKDGLPDDVTVNVDANLPLVRLEWMREVLAGDTGDPVRKESETSGRVWLF